MLIGGALGNILDRLRDGSVTDFIKLPLGWPPFNLADTSITLGVADPVLRRSSAAAQATRAVSSAATPTARSRSPTRTSTCSWSTRRPAWSCTPRAGIARARSRSCSAPLLPRGGEAERAGIVHRLDRDTSGLLVVARSEEAHRLLQAALARAADRARVPGARAGAPAGAQRARSRRRSGATRACARAWPSAATARARRAPTSRSSARSPETSLLRLRLETGRTHQIRVHLQAIGHPVCGDPEYGTRRAARPGAPVPARRRAWPSSIRSRGEPRRGRLAAARGPAARAGARRTSYPERLNQIFDPCGQRIAALPGARHSSRVRVRVHPHGHPIA